MMNQDNMRYWLVFTGSYTPAEREGVETLLFDSAQGTLERIAGFSGVANSSYLAFDERRYVLYAVSEYGEGEVAALRVDRATGRLEEINRQPSHGGSPCYVCIEPDGSRVYVANYMGGNASVYPVRGDGGLMSASDTVRHAGSGPRKDRQEAPHAHSINNDPSGKYRIVCDLGIDRLMIYRTSPDGKFEPAGAINTEPGGGPRHLAFHPSLPMLYLLEELSSTVSVYTFDAETASGKLLQTVPMLPAGYTGANLAADIHLEPGGRYLYASNRGHDSLAVYSVGPDGMLTFIGHAPTGRTPRNFAPVPDGRHLLVAAQDDNRIDVMRIGPDGIPAAVGQPYESTKPVCTVITPAPPELVADRS